MPSINDLRVKCQSGLAGKEIWGYSRIQRGVSIYLTWLWIKLGLSANHVTLLNLVFVSFAALSVVNGLFLVGFLCFHLYFIVDCSDSFLTKFVVNKTAVENNIKCVIAGIKDFKVKLLQLILKRNILVCIKI